MVHSDFHMRHLSVSFLVLAIWYWSIRRLVLEYLLVGTAFEADYVFEDSCFPSNLFSVLPHYASLVD